VAVVVVKLEEAIMGGGEASRSLRKRECLSFAKRSVAGQSKDLINNLHGWGNIYSAKKYQQQF
jgi:hypothetical protein